MSCDSLYVAWLKAHYPYELYVTMLKLYDEKKNRDKISAIISEMKRYKNISLITGQFGQDNRDWFVDRENNTISQSLSSIGYMSTGAAEALYRLGRQTEAEMGVEYTKLKLNDAGKAEQKRLKAEDRKLRKKYEKGEISDDEVLKVGTEINRQLEALQTKDEYVESKPGEIHHTAPLDCFTNVLRAMQLDPDIKKNQIEILISLGYFSKFGGSAKLRKLYNEYYEGKTNLDNKGLSWATAEGRLQALRQTEASLADEDLPAGLRLQSELDYVGLCLSVFPEAPANLYFVESVDDKYGVKVKLYSLQRGTSGIVRIARKDYNRQQVTEGLCLQMMKYNKRPKCTFRNGQRTEIPGEFDCWVTSYSMVYPEKPSAA